MSKLDPLDVYRRMFANAEDGDSTWWYLGVSFANVDGYPTIPVLHVETVMIYRTTTLSADAFRMDWWEIGYMRDPVTGEVAERWTNPITGKTVPSPRKFEEGPSYFIIARDGDGLKLDLVQAHARIDSVSVRIVEHGDRIELEQIERKTRGFPLPDGSMPSLDSKDVSKARTRLSLFSAKADLARPDAPSSGSYDFELAAPGWMGFGDMPARSLTHGVMVKAGMNEKINPTAWRRLQALFPDCFDGEAIRPRWPAAAR